MSEVCAAFGCTPSVAEQEDLELVRQVLDYRTAVAAKEIFNGRDRSRAFEALRKQPRLLEVLGMMYRAQAGLPLHGVAAERLRAEGATVAGVHRDAPEDTETDAEQD